MGLVKSVRGCIILSVGIAGVSLVSTKNSREKLVHACSKIKTKTLNYWKKQPSEVVLLLEKAGHPNPYDIGDSRMIDEGSLTGIQYYNKIQ
ncbi:MULTISPECIES: hypothetical protein [Bacillaceae]|uniref:Uncharacterized protein n=1 Tax=Peribacillus huizhouensis TaxID=1501239 RepID=A0ABR6CPP3_9BACI|nr:MULTISPECIES: hypothetical protein [Bacillaceae]MBA9027007.1 hypothetical protein [Peribacillus huizhouensis]